MFGLSTWELIIIVAIALIFIGPDQLPKVAKQVGKHLRQVRGAVEKVDVEVRRAVREAAAEVEEHLDLEEKAEAKAAEAAEMERQRLGKPPPQPELASPAPGAQPLGAKERPPLGAPAPGTPAPPAAPAAAMTTPDGRDWSQVGKTPIEGRVPSARPARSLAAVPPPAPDAPAPDAPAPDPASTSPTSAPTSPTSSDKPAA